MVGFGGDQIVLGQKLGAGIDVGDDVGIAPGHQSERFLIGGRRHIIKGDAAAARQGAEKFRKKIGTALIRLHHDLPAAVGHAEVGL